MPQQAEQAQDNYQPNTNNLVSLLSHSLTYQNELNKNIIHITDKARFQIQIYRLFSC